MATSLQIANLALAALPEDPIDSFDGSSRAATLCRTHLPLVAAAEFRLYPCPDTNTRVSLPAAATGPEFGWTYRYPLPVDCLAVRKVQGLSTREWGVSRRAIETDATGPLQVVYTADVTRDINGLPLASGEDIPIDPLLATVIAYRLAMVLAAQLTDSHTTAANLEQIYRDAVTRFKAALQKERPPRVESSSTWGNWDWIDGESECSAPVVQWW